MKEEDIIRNDLLQEIVCHSSKCAHCIYFHKETKDEDSFCFYAYACLTKDFYYFDDGD